MASSMITVLQIETFASKPFKDKTVTEVPGVGPKLKEKLVAAGVKKPSDLYQRLLKCGLDKEKFKCWMTKEVCSKARVPTVYAALMAWHKQFGHGNNIEHGNESQDDETEAPAQPIRVGKSRRKRRVSSASTHQAKTRRNSVQFNIPEDKPRTSTKDDRHNKMIEEFLLDDRSTQPSHPLIKFLAALSTVFKNIPEEHHSEFRRDVLALADKYEDKTRLKERQHEAQPSTSNTLI